jgi:hypothetical protein
MAGVVGSRQQTVAQVIACFKQQGYIDIRGNCMFLANPEALFTIAGLEKTVDMNRNQEIAEEGG